MRDSPVRRLLTAVAFASLLGVLLAWANPVGRIKADLRADAQGFVMSLEYIAHNVAS